MAEFCFMFLNDKHHLNQFKHTSYFFKLGLIHRVIAIPKKDHY